MASVRTHYFVGWQPPEIPAEEEEWASRGASGKGRAAGVWGDVVTITGTGSWGRIRVLGFALSRSHSPPLPFYPIQTKLGYLCCMAGVCFSSRAFCFHQHGMGCLGNRDYSIAQSPSGDESSGIHLRNKEILGELERRNEAGERLHQTFALQLGATWVGKRGVWMPCSCTCWYRCWVLLILVLY